MCVFKEETEWMEDRPHCVSVCLEEESEWGTDSLHCSLCVFEQNDLPHVYRREEPKERKGQLWTIPTQKDTELNVAHCYPWVCERKGEKSEGLSVVRAVSVGIGGSIDCEERRRRRMRKRWRTVEPLWLHNVPELAPPPAPHQRDSIVRWDLYGKVLH